MKTTAVLWFSLFCFGVNLQQGFGQCAPQLFFRDDDGAVMGAFNAAANGGNFGDILLGAIIGGVAAGLGAGVANLAAGGGFFSAAALSVKGFGAGFAAGFAGGFVSGFVGATLNGLASGQNIGEAIGGGLRAGVTAGVLAGLAACIGAGVKAKKAGANFWDGTKDTPLVSSVNEITTKGVMIEDIKPQQEDISGLRRIEANKPPHWPTEHKVVTSKYNLGRFHPKDGIIKAHTGVDMRSYLNNKNFAIHDGVVSKVYTQGQGSGGNYIKINHGNGIESGYFHTKSNLKVGDIVRRGQIIGVSDGSGIINAPHLHFTLKVGNKLINPMEYLNFLEKIKYKQ